jgi:aminoglycoside phosphotransferase family enzyme/predicted kinase
MQDAVFAFLGQPSTHGGSAVHRHETHAAVVFLAGDRALKVKRAVRFPFLDYSTLEKRKIACHAELDVNRRFAPELYRRVVPITRKNGELELDGAGEPVEWAVEMARFDENQTLDRVAERGELTDNIASKLAVAVVAMHAKAEPVPAAPWIAAVESYIGQNTDAFRDFEGLFPAENITALDRRSRAAFARLRPLLEARGQRALIRRAHGDLHLGNIAMLNNSPVAFDAIEFDPIIASGDVLYDLAFLLMDLIERGLLGPANIVLNEYFAAAQRNEDFDGLAALPFFMSLRAAIRAKVTAARLNNAAHYARAEVSSLARRYFDLAVRLLAPSKAVLACIGGLSGTGKSVLARTLAPFIPPPPGALVLRSDSQRKAMFGVLATERLPPVAYGPEVSERLYAELTERAKRVVCAGHSVIVDAVFARPSERAEIEAAARRTKAKFLGVFLTADLATRLKRIGGRKADASDADPNVARRQEDFTLGPMTWLQVDASGTPAETLAKVRAFFA